MNEQTLAEISFKLKQVQHNKKRCYLL